MRVLFVTYAEYTHFLAMVPIAWALRAAGHEVRVASQPDFAPTINASGLTAVGVGRNLNIDRLLELDPDWETAGRTTIPEPYDVAVDPDRADYRSMAAAYARQLERWHKVENAPLVPDLVRFSTWWQPDLVVWEPTTYAGAIAAHVSGAAHARILFGLDLQGATRQHFLRLLAEQPTAADASDPLADWLTAYVHRYGRDYAETLSTGDFTIDQLPPGMQLPTGLPMLHSRFVPYGGPAEVPAWLREPPTRPRVAISLGLVATERFDGYTLDLQDILDHLGHLDIEIVATIPEAERRKLHGLAGNIRLIDFVPLAALAATCCAVIHHAGFGTLCTTATYRLPHLVIPGDIDGPALGEALARLGVAIVLDSTEATGARVREELCALLEELEIRERAAQLDERTRELPAPAHLVGQLEALSLAHRRR